LRENTTSPRSTAGERHPRSETLRAPGLDPLSHRRQA
jgi:hypothetical protein